MAFDGARSQGYLARAKKAEMLDVETELALKLLVSAYIKLAVSMAAGFRRYGAPMEELVQEATLGLLKAPGAALAVGAPRARVCRGAAHA